MYTQVYSKYRTHVQLHVWDKNQARSMYYRHGPPNYDWLSCWLASVSSHQNQQE